MRTVISVSGVLLNDGKGNFAFAENRKTGLVIRGDAKDAGVITVNGTKYLLIGINNTGLVNYKMN